MEGTFLASLENDSVFHVTKMLKMHISDDMGKWDVKAFLLIKSLDSLVFSKLKNLKIQSVTLCVNIFFTRELKLD